MNVTLVAHTQLSINDDAEMIDFYRHIHGATDGQAVALTAIRTCYSHLKPTRIVLEEGSKYFDQDASDGKGGTEADRLTRHIVGSGHSSTLEHLSFTFAIEGVSRSLLAQLTRNRVGFSFSVQSQRYVRFGSGDKGGGFDYVVPQSIKDKGILRIFENAMKAAQDDYDTLRKLGIPPEDARAVLPNATATNLTMTANLTALLSFYSKRRKGRGAQAEIAQLAEALRKCVVDVEPWTDAHFEVA